MSEFLPYSKRLYLSVLVNFTPAAAILAPSHFHTVQLNMDHHKVLQNCSSCALMKWAEIRDLLLPLLWRNLEILLEIYF